jgi:hypothetical protein
MLEVQDRGTKHRITPTYFYNYWIMPHHGSPIRNYLFPFRRLFQDFLVFCYKKSVAHSLKFLKMDQPSLRAHNYGTLQDQRFTDNINEGGEGIRGGGLFLLQAILEVLDIRVRSFMLHCICVQDFDVHPFSSHLLQIPNGLIYLRQFTRLLQPLQVTWKIL